MTATTHPKPACIASGLPDVGIYVACLAAYNDGILHGAWIDLEGDTDEDDIQEAMDWVIKTSPLRFTAEEWAIHDSAGLPSYLSRTEHPALTDLVAWADGLSNFADQDHREAYRLACEDQGQTLDEDSFRETYCGNYADGAEYASYLAEETDVVPLGNSLAWPLTCIDWEGAWRELTYDGYREEDCASGGVHIFRSC